MQRFPLEIRLLYMHGNRYRRADAAALLVVLIALSACSTGATRSDTGSREGSGATTATPSPEPTPEPKVVVVSANLRESHAMWPDDVTGEPYADLQSMTELSNFVDHVARLVPRPPDVLLLQEVIAVSARETAKQLREKFDRPYAVVVASGDSNQIGPKFDYFKHKRNTAIIINEAQMDVVGKVGYMSLNQRPGDWPVGRFGVAQEQAHALLRHRPSGVEVGVMSVHWATNPKFGARRLGTARRIEWAHQVTAFMSERFGRADIQVMGGEFSVNRCGVWQESLRCDEHPAYEVITDGRNGFKDAVLVASRHSKREFARQVENRNGDPHRIDYIFSTGTVHAASRSVDYLTQKFTPRYFSDHKYDYAVLGP